MRKHTPLALAFAAIATFYACAQQPTTPPRKPDYAPATKRQATARPQTAQPALGPAEQTQPAAVAKQNALGYSQRFETEHGWLDVQSRDPVRRLTLAGPFTLSLVFDSLEKPAEFQIAPDGISYAWAGATCITPSMQIHDNAGLLATVAIQ